MASRTGAATIGFAPIVYKLYTALPALVPAGISIRCTETYECVHDMWFVCLTVSVPDRDRVNEFHPPLRFREPRGLFPSPELVTQLMLLT